MPLTELQTALADAKTAYQEKDQEIKGYIAEKSTQETRLKALETQITAKQQELRAAMSQATAEALTTELNTLKSQKQACETLVTNISNYLKVKARSEKEQAQGRIQSAEKNLLLFVYQDIQSQLNVLSDEHKALLKDFVVIGRMLSESLPGQPRPSYYLGYAFDVLYGELRGEAFSEHKEQMLAKYTS
ncbi:glyoxalase [Vibrio parahaemolyticus]|uniref:glyoxalase n=1 Tax=Vibrio parahaemolyticus TaxID=670 RepID=UPI0008DA0F14|nr:glyoxalase [Vibrio parahaemolyticus]MBM5088756.1 glyoxalase [Vibrio parahaemolyticus]MBM5180373.1 glyoxalase [Vibrio parahaemolyticus]OHX42496.1 glyoxalase [Vibrio parahaemolyticus]